MPECPNAKKTRANCNCTYSGCARYGVCCECVAYHRINFELPACYFDGKKEKTYDRSIDNYFRKP